jgi:hypothetical protein
MRRIVFFFIVLLMFTFNFTCNGVAIAEPLWPINLKLMTNDWVQVGSQLSDEVGDVSLWNTQSGLYIKVTPYDLFKIRQIEIFIAPNDEQEDFDSILNTQGKPTPGSFTYKTDYPTPADEHVEEILLGSELDMCWGAPEKCPTTRYIVVHVQLVKPDPDTGGFVNVTAEGAFARGDKDFSRFTTGSVVDAGVDWAWYVTYPVAKVQPGHFIDAPVFGLTYQTPTQSGSTNESGEFFYIPEERVDFSVGSLPLGNLLGSPKVSQEDLFEGSGLDDHRVVNVARLLQSLDADGDAQDGSINITEPICQCLESALTSLELTEVDFENDDQVESLIQASVSECGLAGHTLIPVSAEDAKKNLDQGQRAANIIKKNVSKTPAMASDKAKLNIMPVYVPALKADGTPTEVVYYDKCGNEIQRKTKAKPIVITYLDEVEGTGAMDTFVAISLDDGQTWKRRNLSRTADKSSLTLESGDAYPGNSQKPVLQVKGNKIFVAWTDKYCKGGRPGYAINVCPDTTGDGIPDPCDVCRDTDEVQICEPDYTGDDAYYKDDIFGVGGPQRSISYDPLEFPDKGEVPYGCVWAARGFIDPQTGDIVWFKPERLTSGRRDAMQLFMGACTGAGFALTWQEDPDGLRPGNGHGPGSGWAGATTNHSTDIWYSFIKWADFNKIDANYFPPEGGSDDIVDTDPELSGMEKALVPMSLPVRISDNDVCNSENMGLVDGLDGDGMHRYCSEVPGVCDTKVTMLNENGETKSVCKTTDGRLLDGNTGASRPNVFLQPYTKKLSDGTTTKSAWAILGYEETKGLGAGPSEYDEEGNEIPQDVEDEGKDVIYHSFDFTEPKTVKGGGIVNLPERDANGKLVIGENGEYLRENARRIRFVCQPKSQIGESETILLALYRQGVEGKGRPADIFVRRMKASPTGNPYAFENFICDQDDGNGMCLKGSQNISSVTPTEIWTQLETESGTGTEKVTKWAWTPSNLDDESSKNPYSNAQAHRGTIRGDKVMIGYTLTPSWAASKTANDKHDFYIRRSFTGGKTWTTDPTATEDIDHQVVYMDPVTKEETVTVTSYGPGVPEPPRNVSNLRSNRFSVIEPRVMAAPGTIKNPDGSATDYPEDIQDTSKYHLTYGLELNQAEVPGELPNRVPLDIHYSSTRDGGQSYDTVLVTPQSGDGTTQERWESLNRGMQEQSAAQIRTTPDGSRYYGLWLEEGESGSDIWFGRIDYRVGDGCSAIPGDLDGDGDVDRDDVYALRPYLNHPDSDFPEGDIDGDGVITVLDVRKLMMMCTCPRCVCP